MGVERRIRDIEPLKASHDISRFRNERHKSLDEWLRMRAHASEGLSARTYVACSFTEPNRVIGYYAISAAEEERVFLPSAGLRRAMPDKVPLFLIGRLAVDVEFQGAGIGTDLLAHALRNCLAISTFGGVRGIVTHAIDDEAVRFYEKNSFRRSPLGERMMFIKIEAIRELFPGWKPPPYPSTSS
jgi:GNAT superfamily N-acetyltransferase